MTMIYQPAGRAGEYAPWAANLYRGCPHGCKYPCYAAELSARQGWFPSVSAFHAQPKARWKALEEFRADALRACLEGRSLLVQLSFLTDPYQPLEAELGLTRAAIQALRDPAPLNMFGTHTRHNAQILTKAGELAMRDLDLLASWPGNLFGVSLTTLDSDKAAVWEPGAAPPRDRCAAAAAAHALGITTWGSFEPVLWPGDSLLAMEAMDKHLDCIAAGRLNHAAPPEPIDWGAYKREVLRLCTAQGRRRVRRPADTKPGEKTFLIKDDLDLEKEK